MEIIDNTFFVGTIKLANTSSSMSEGAVLAELVSKFAPQYLKTILGYSLYTLFEANIDESSGIYYDLLNGATYTDLRGLTQEWQGFNKIYYSPIANYVYCESLKDSERSNLAIGTMRPNAENMVLSSAGIDVARAWNEMVDFNLRLHDFLYANSSSYRTYIGLQFLPPQRTGYSIPITSLQENQYLFIKTSNWGL